MFLDRRSLSKTVKHRNLGLKNFNIFAVFLLLASVSGLLVAAENALIFGASVSGTGNDNFSLSESAKREVYTGTGALKLGLERNTERTQSRVEWDGRYRRFAGDNESLRNYPSHRFTGDLVHAFSERVEGSVGADYVMDRTTADEIEIENSLFVVQEKEQDKTRENRSVNGVLNARISEAMELQFAVSNSSLRYEDAETTRLIAYDYHQINIALVKAFSDRLSGRLGISGSKFDPRPEDSLIQRLNTTASDSRLVDTGLRWLASEKFQLDLGFSWRRTEYEPLAGIKTRDDGYDGSLEMTRQLNSSSWSVSLNRSLDPTSDGRQITKDAVSIDLSHQLSEQSSTRIRLLGERDVQQTLTGRDEDKYGEIGLTYSHRLSSEQYASLSFRHRKLFESGETDRDAVHSNSFSLSWTWAPKSKSF